jgi:hypothetical protein
MQKAFLFGVLIALVTGLATTDASACGRRRHRSHQCCSCSPPRMHGLTIVEASCGGGAGTYTGGDVPTLCELVPKGGGTPIPCTCGKYHDGYWSCNCNRPPTGTYRLHVKADSGAESYSAYFNCP